MISRALHLCRFWALLLITYFWVNYKLFRLNTYIDLPWNLHVYIALPFVLTGLIIHLSLITKFSTIMKTRGTIALIFCLLWFVLLHLVIFNNGDQYLLAALNFFLFYPFYYFLRTKDTVTLVKFFDYLIFLLSLTCCLEVILFFSQSGIFDYFKDERFNPSTLSTVHPILSFRGRPTGFAGSVYATSAMLAGFGVYSLYQKKYFLHVVILIALFLYATPSILIVYIIYSFMAKFSYKKLLILLIFLGAIYPIIEYRLTETNELKYWLPTFETNYSPKEILIGSLIGFGVHSPKIDGGELRIFTLILSWGILPTIIIGVLYRRLLTYAKFLDKKNMTIENFKYVNILPIPFIVFLSNWHYETVMVFPNTTIIFFIFAIIIKNFYTFAGAK